jgi:hypothetical protein
MLFRQFNRIIKVWTHLHAQIEALPIPLRRVVYTLLKEILADLASEEDASHFTFLLKGKEITMLELTATQKADVNLKVTTAAGRPATLDGVPVWTSSDENVATVDPSGDGMSATVRAVNADGGVCQITASGDADLGAGVVTITGFLDVTVAPGAGGQAAVFELVAGPPSEQ